MARILIVEDEADSSDALAEFLRRAGHKTVAVPNGKDALSSIIQSPPDLIVLDLLMPEMDGANLLQIIRSYLRLQALPVVVWTGASDGAVVERARNYGISAIVSKGQSNYNGVLQAIQEAMPWPQ